MHPSDGFGRNLCQRIRPFRIDRLAYSGGHVRHNIERPPHHRHSQHSIPAAAEGGRTAVALLASSAGGDEARLRLTRRHSAASYSPAASSPHGQTHAPPMVPARTFARRRAAAPLPYLLRARKRRDHETRAFSEIISGHMVNRRQLLVFLQ